MDSRIREIEQWLAKAKTGLIECGREDYINRLYLLDAEIRAVIKENGIQPGATSPKRRAGKVRRFNTPALAFGSVIAAFLLTATTAYLADPAIGVFTRHETGSAPAPVVADYASADIPEVPAGTAPAAVESQAEWPVQTEPVVIADPPASRPVIQDQVTAPAPAVVARAVHEIPSPVAAQRETNMAPPLMPTPIHGTRTAPAVIAVSPATSEPELPFEMNAKTSSVLISSGAIDREIGRFTYFPELPDIKEQSPEDQDAVNVLKSQLSGANTDSITVDSVDSDESPQDGSVDNSKR